MFREKKPYYIETHKSEWLSTRKWSKEECKVRLFAKFNRDTTYSLVEWMLFQEATNQKKSDWAKFLLALTNYIDQKKLGCGWLCLSWNSVNNQVWIFCYEIILSGNTVLCCSTVLRQRIRIAMSIAEEKLFAIFIARKQIKAILFYVAAIL